MKAFIPKCDTSIWRKYLEETFPKCKPTLRNVISLESRIFLSDVSAIISTQCMYHFRNKAPHIYAFISIF